MNRLSSILQDISLKFSGFTAFDVLDVVVVAFLLYHLIKFVRGTGAERLLKGLVILLVVTWLSTDWQLQVLRWILNGIITVGPVALVVLFQPELRKMLERFGRTRFNIFRGKVSDRKVVEQAIFQTIEAVAGMSKEKIGALIVFEKNDPLTALSNTGTFVNADISAHLLKNVFYPKAPLHDGAVIVSGARLEAAGCILPLSNTMALSKDLGTRHRAALGVSEGFDAVTVVVSEETGAISFCSGGILKRHLAPETLERLLFNELLPADADDPQKKTLWQRLKGGKKS